MPDSFSARPHSPILPTSALLSFHTPLAMKTRNPIARALRIVWPEADEQLPDFEQTPPARVPHSS